MSDRKIVISKEARGLLRDLDDLFLEFHRLTALLAERGTSNQVAMDAGAVRESVKSRISSCAFMLNKATCPAAKKEAA
jgi:hypothetical protein